MCVRNYAIQTYISSGKKNILFLRPQETPASYQHQCLKYTANITEQEIFTKFLSTGATSHGQRKIMRQDVQ